MVTPDPLTRAESLAAIRSAVLYGIVDLGYCEPAYITQACRSLIAGGAGVIQLRAKSYPEEQILEMARELSPLCRELRVPFIVNDFPNIAVEVQADGVHIGQDDGSLAEVRKSVGDTMIVGRSTHSVDQARQAKIDGFDYAGFGPLFPTPTKQGRPGIGLENVKLVEAEISPDMPLFYIGGVTPESLPQVLDAGAKRVVVVSSLLTAENIEKATADLVEQLKEKRL